GVHRLLVRCERGREVERRTDSRLALQPDLASHHVDQLGGDRQSQASSAILPRRRHVGLRKSFEDSRLLMNWNANTGVAHGEMECVVGLRGRSVCDYNADGDLTVTSKFDGVA